MNPRQRKKQATPRVESLEALTLLSTLPVIGGIGQVHAAAITSGGPATGLGSIGAVKVTDAQALQQDSSGGYLEQYISEVELQSGRRANVRQFAQSVVADHQITNFDLANTATAVGITLPAGIATPSDVKIAEQVLAAVRGGNVDAAYLKAMQQINAQDVANDQQLTNQTADSAVRAYASETQGYDQNHLQGARQLLRSPGSTYSTTYPTTTINTPPTVTTPASASDAQALQQDLSGGALEQFISQIEAQRGSRGDVQQYAQTVVGDHQVTNFDLLNTAQTVGVTLPSGITQASDIAYAKQVLAAARGRNLDRTYLRVMQQINSQDVANDQQLIASTTNAAVGTYAQETLSYNMTHLQGAQRLLTSQSSTYTAGG